MSSYDFDAFLSYNTKDESAVKKIASRLEAESIVTRLDIWELVPGRLNESKTA